MNYRVYFENKKTSNLRTVLIRRYNFVLDHCFSNGYHCRIEKGITSCFGSCVRNTAAAGFSHTCNNQSKAHSNTCQFLKVTHNKCITLSKGCPPTWPRALACAAVSTSPVAKNHAFLPNLTFHVIEFSTWKTSLSLTIWVVGFCGRFTLSSLMRRGTLADVAAVSTAWAGPTQALAPARIPLISS